MSTNSSCTVYVGNLDERVSDRVLYDILIQAGRVIDLHIPRDRETDKPKGYAFAEYETEEIAEYAVKLFSGLVTLYNRTLRFAISGQDKQSQNLSGSFISTPDSFNRVRPHPGSNYNTEISPHSTRLSTQSVVAAYSSHHSQGVSPHPNGHGSRSDGTNYEYSRRVLGSTLDNINRNR